MTYNEKLNFFLVFVLMFGGCQPDYQAGRFEHIETDQVTIKIWVPNYLNHYSIDTIPTDYGEIDIFYGFGSGGSDSINKYIGGYGFEKAILDTLSLSISLPDIRYSSKRDIPINMSYIDAMAERFYEINPDGFIVIDKSKELINGRQLYLFEYSFPFDTTEYIWSLTGLVQVDSLTFSVDYHYYGKDFSQHRDDAYQVMRSIKLKKK